MHLKNTVQEGEGPSLPAELEQAELAGEGESGEGLLWVCQTMLSGLNRTVSLGFCGRKHPTRLQ